MKESDQNDPGDPRFPDAGSMEALRHSEEMFRLSAHQHALLVAIPDIVMEVDLRMVYTWANQPGIEFFGDDAIGKEASFYFEGEQRTYDLVRPLFQGNEHVLYVESWQRRRDGQKRLLAWRCAAIRDESGNVTGAISSARDITERQQRDQAIQDLEVLYRSLVENLQQCVFRKDPDGRFTFANQRFCDLVARPLAELIGRTDFDLFPRELAEKYRRDDQRIMAGGQSFEDVESHRTPTGEERFVQVVKTPLRDVAGQIFGVQGIFWDVTERKRAEAEKEKLRAQLTQAQKMESVGRLAGGVAHDFNNMLQAILGNAAMALQDLPPDSPLRESLEEIQKSAERSADLTRQLLAFARKQTIQPKVLDLNDTVSGMLKMLRRLIGENIHLAWVPGADLWSVKLDPSQIDQILANLCVNARDAIASSGKVTIETGNATLDNTYAGTHPECAPGDYVLLAVSDTGPGIDRATRAHLFEPFFTTKEVGKGTGLGLATVFGIVHQNRGLINVYSEPGQGTSFKIYLPRAELEPMVAEPRTVRRSFRGTETVLLVEDEKQILSLGQRILEQRGYLVLGASTPETALALAARHAGPIGLLITDVVMPGMNGRALFDRLRASHPQLKCLFMSGYTADVIAHHGVLDEGVDFLQKPFTIQTLEEKVRDVLEEAQMP